MKRDEEKWHFSENEIINHQFNLKKLLTFVG